MKGPNRVSDPTPMSNITEAELGLVEAKLQKIRDDEYPQLKDKVYLDHGGTTLYAKSLMEEFSRDMVTNLYGNPHSESSPSAASSQRVEKTRIKALEFFNADPRYWDLVFVANATAAIKLVADCVRDYALKTKTKTWYGYHKDAHTSLVGARELMSKHRCFVEDGEVDDWIQKGCPKNSLLSSRLGLFAYPAQSNMTGRRLPLNWCSRIRDTNPKTQIYTLLDAAAFASTAQLNLQDPEQSPDFVALSFYKIFGFPDLGALLVQKRHQPLFEQRRFFGGGTVEMVVAVDGSWNAKKDTSIHDRLEDGTLPFHSIIALDHAIDVHRRLYGESPMEAISKHTVRLAKVLYDGLASLRHWTGQPVVYIYKDPRSVYGVASTQGATLAFNVVKADGQLAGYTDVEKAADRMGIFVRSGSLCNPGGFATYLNWAPAEMRAAYDAGHRCSRPQQLVQGKATGVVRASIGAMSTLRDVECFVEFIRLTYAQPAPPAGLVGQVTAGPLSAKTITFVRDAMILAMATY